MIDFKDWHSFNDQLPADGDLILAYEPISQEILTLRLDNFNIATSLYGVTHWRYPPKHSILPPSSAARRVACPGSRKLEALNNDIEDSPAAREGEAAHWLAALMLHDPSHSDFIKRLPNQTAFNGELLTEEMYEGAELYCDTIYSILKPFNVTANDLYIEERVDITRIHSDCWGTPDCWFFKGNQLFIFDYKFGHGYVEVFENWQLIEYAAGIIEYLKINGQYDQLLIVNFYIIQPRCYTRDGTVRSWQIKGSDLRPYFNILEKAENEALQEYAPCNPNPLCDHCKGRFLCPALQQAAMNVLDRSLLNIPLELTPEALGTELRYLKRSNEMLQARITGLEGQIASLLRQGKRVPFFKLENSLGRERWKVSTEEVITLGELMQCDLQKPKDVITPHQARKLGIPDNIIDSYTERFHTSFKIVLDQDNQQAKKIFK